MKVVLVVVMACAVWVPARVHAEDWSWRRGVRSDLANERGGVAGELSFYSSEQQSVVSPLFGGWYVLNHRWLLSLDWGALFVRDTRVTRDVGNPLLAGTYAVEMDGVRTELSLGVALPASHIRSGDPAIAARQENAHDLTSALTGWWDLWLWQAETFSPEVQVHAESMDEHMLLALDIGGGALVPIHSSADWDALVQAALDGGWRDEWGAVGMRFQVVWRGRANVVQSALEPFFRVAIGKGFLSMRGTLNLDAPLGVAGGGARIWSVAIGAGAAL